MKLIFIEFKQIPMEETGVELVVVNTCRCCIAVSEEEPFDNIFQCIYEGINLEDILNALAPISLAIDDGEYSRNTKLASF